MPSVKNDADAKQLAIWVEALEKGMVSLEDCAAHQPPLPEETMRMLELVDEIRQRPPVRPTQEFRHAARARLLNKISVAAPTQPRAFVPRRPLNLRSFAYRGAARVVALAALLLVILTTGTAYASTYALPGDLVYPVKGWMEQMRIRFSTDEQLDTLYQQYTQERAEEIQALIAQERYSDLPAAFDQVERQFETLDANPASKEQIRALQAQLSRQGEVLTSLLETVSEDARPAIEQALSASSRSQERLSDLTGETTPPGEPPGLNQDKPYSGAAPSLPPQANPNAAKGQPPAATATPVSLTPEPQDPTVESPAFVPPGQEGKDNGNASQSNAEPPRGSSASNGRGQKGKPCGSPGRSPFRTTCTPPAP